jgi:predicted ATP-grasp superfamily ATP-dependent carboligase
VSACRAAAGVQWIRLVTDVPTSLLEMVGGRLPWREYVRSLRTFQIESVFCTEDLLPGLVELALVPYLFVKRGY